MGAVGRKCLTNSLEDTELCPQPSRWILMATVVPGTEGSMRGVSKGKRPKDQEPKARIVIGRTELISRDISSKMLAQKYLGFCGNTYYHGFFFISF